MTQTHPQPLARHNGHWWIPDAARSFTTAIRWKSVARLPRRE